jgi:hypothetical protein
MTTRAPPARARAGARAGAQLAPRRLAGGDATLAGASAAARAAASLMTHAHRATAGHEVALPSFARFPSGGEPPAKRARSAAAEPAADDDPLTAAARAKLDQLQRSLGEANPMTLEELKASQPEIHAKLLAEAAARDPRPLGFSSSPSASSRVFVAARRPRSARPRARARRDAARSPRRRHQRPPRRPAARRSASGPTSSPRSRPSGATATI